MDGFFKFGSPTLELSIETRKVEMLLDTGFNGHLMLPQIIIDELGLEQIGISDYLAASGEHTATKVYKGEIRFLDDGVERVFDAEVGKEYRVEVINGVTAVYLDMEKRHGQYQTQKQESLLNKG